MLSGPHSRAMLLCVTVPLTQQLKCATFSTCKQAWRAESACAMRGTAVADGETVNTKTLTRTEIGAVDTYFSWAKHIQKACFDRPTFTSVPGTQRTATTCTGHWRVYDKAEITRWERHLQRQSQFECGQWLSDNMEMGSNYWFKGVRRPSCWKQGLSKQPNFWTASPKWKKWARLYITAQMLWPKNQIKPFFF